MGVKGFKAKGKRITTYAVEKIEELEPTRFPEEQDNGDDDASGGSDGTANDSVENLDPDAGKSQRQVIDEITGQLELFPDDE